MDSPSSKTSARASATRIVKQALRRAAENVPFRDSLVRAAALAPPGLKAAGLVRAARLLLEQEPSSEPVTTNLGIDGNLRIEVPKSSGPGWLFGTPDSNLGERGSLALARTLLSDCTAFVDVGAHLGYFTFTILAWRTPRQPIYFFEPNPALFELLERNLRANRAEHVHGFRVAVSDRSGTARFFVHAGSDLTSSLVASELHAELAREIEVETTSFDDFARRLSLRELLVKVDIENAEAQFVAGASEEHGRIKYLVVELLGPAIEQGMVNRIREQFGMHAYYINDFQLESSPDGRYTYVPPQYNWLFCRLAPDALAARLRNSPLHVRGA